VPPTATQATKPVVNVEATEPPAATATPMPQTPVPAPPAPSIDIEPTATATASGQPSGSPKVVGDSAFVTWTNQALALLQSKAPAWYQQVARYLDEILQVPTGTGRIHVGTKTFQAGPDTVHATMLTPAYSRGITQAQSRDLQLEWYAGSIVHDSCHERLYENGQQYMGKDAEIACLKDQKAALLQIESLSALSDYVQGLIDGADDPANQYWLNPHW
jgi:hypothetical protein